jgi:LDH2 family malate/lactate/ureidoglycolate dehydrogenase
MPQPPLDVPPIAAAELERFCKEVLVRLALPPDEAELIARCLVEADLRDVHSHGVIRLPVYAERLAAGATNPRPRVRVVRETRTTAVVDGDNGMGQLVSERAMRIAIDKAAEGDCVFVSVFNSNHNGTEAYFAEMAARAGMVGIVFNIGGINHMAPWGGAEAMLGNNPFAIAMPGGIVEPPVVLDMACSVAARGKVKVAANRGEPIPEGWCTGPDGRPTTDPHEALKGFVLPLGGPKGYALTTLVAMLSTLLSGAAIGREVTHLYDDMENPQNGGHLMGVLPVASFVESAEYRTRLDRFAAELRGARKAPGVERIYLPGERERLAMRVRTVEGIPLASGTVDDLVELGERLGVSYPGPEQG